jgi:hypothetical protein
MPSAATWRVPQPEGIVAGRSRSVTERLETVVNRKGGRVQLTGKRKAESMRFPKLGSLSVRSERQFEFHQFKVSYIVEVSQHPKCQSGNIGKIEQVLDLNLSREVL